MCFLQDMKANQELTEAIRGAIKDRATWFYLLLKGAREQGVNSEQLAEKAIFTFGQLKAKKLGQANTPREFFNGIATKNAALAFAMEEVAVGDKQGVYRFHHCALCDAWRDLGCTQDEIHQLCKLAMQGDFGLVSAFPLELTFNSTIGEGADYCEMVITKEQ